MRRIGLALVLICGLVGSVHAEGLYVHGDVGVSLITKLPADGTWHQDALPQELNTTSVAYRAGLGYAWERWYVEASYLKMGTYNTGAPMGA